MGSAASQLVTRCACCHWLWGQVVTSVTSARDSGAASSPLRPGFRLIPQGSSSFRSGSRYITGPIAGTCDDCGMTPICGPCCWVQSLTGRTRCCLCRRARLDEVSWHLAGTWRAQDDPLGRLGTPTQPPPPSATLTWRERRAMEEYEWFHGLQDGEATFQQVRDSEGGIEGWWASALRRIRMHMAALGAYERFHGLQRGEASLHLVDGSPEGLEGWAAAGRGLSAGDADLMGAPESEG